MQRYSVYTLLISAMTAGMIGTVAAESPAEFYKGRTVSLILSSGTGGGYDTLGRLVAKHLPRMTPGSPNIVVKNMPGAGGIVATNYLYASAEKDGSVIGGVSNNTPLEPLYGTKQVRYDATKFNWLGSPATEIGLLIVWHTHPATTVELAKKHEIAVGSSGAASTPSFYARILNDLLGTKLKIVVGYKGQNDAFLAMERGELDGYPSTFYSSLKAIRPQWITEKKVRLLVQYGAEKEAELADVPFAPDLVTKPEDKELLSTAFAPLGLGRPYLMPPDVPADRVKAVQDAMEALFKDSEFSKDTAAAKLPVTVVRTGPQLAAIIEAAYKASPATIERIRKLQSATD